MDVVGIVAEYNPFHAGHAFHIRETRRRVGECAVAAVMSGNFVQRGECAVFDKWTRARAALEGGADLVLELPTVWAVSSAEGFARGAAAILAATGAVTHLSFGSECGDVDKLRRLADCLDSPMYRTGLRRFLDEGQPFAACRQKAVRELLGEALAELLSQPNNNLGVEYIRALNRLGSPILPVTVSRAGAAHDGGGHPEYPSASFLREEILSEAQAAGKPENQSHGGCFCPPAQWAGGPAFNPASLAYGERGALAVLRSMDEEAFAALPDSGEGLANRMYAAVRRGRTLEEVYQLAKTKRYAHSRVRRMALWGALGLREQDRPDSPAYLRVLGANERGRGVLREIKDRAALPIITKPAHGRGLPLLELEARCTDFYELCRREPGPCGTEWIRSPVMV